MDISKYEKIWANNDWSDADIFIYRNRETGLYRGEVYIEMGLQGRLVAEREGALDDVIKGLDDDINRIQYDLGAAAKAMRKRFR